MPTDHDNSTDASARAPSKARRHNRRRLAIVLALTVTFALLGGAAAFIIRPYSATVRLHSYENTFASSAEAADFVTSATSTNALAKVAAKITPQPTVNDLASRCRVAADAQSAYISVTAIADSAHAAQATANALASVVASSADEWVRRRTTQADSQVKATQKRLSDLRKQFSGFDEALLTTDIRGVRQSLTKQTEEKAAAVAQAKAELQKLESQKTKMIAAVARDNPARSSLEKELQQALTRYTDQHPKVKELKASLTNLYRQASSKTTTNAQLIAIRQKRDAAREELKKTEDALASARASLQRFATNEVEFVRLQSEFAALSARRDDLIKARVLLSNKALEKWRRSDHVETARVLNTPRIAAFSAGSGAAGLAIGLLAVATMRRRDSDFIRDETDLIAATGLPVVATLPPIGTMTESAREFWAVETFELLRRAAGVPRLGSFICGITSSLPHEGRSTVIELLARAGLKNGNRVLVISLPVGEPAATAAGAASTMSVEAAPDTFLRPQPVSAAEHGALARYTLSTSVAHALSHRYWERSLTSWKSEENAVVLVELPPAATADSLLLSSALPNVVWLSGAQHAPTGHTTRCVNSLRKTGCNFIGAILNMHPALSSRHAAIAAVTLAMSVFTATAQAQNSPPPPAEVTAVATPSPSNVRQPVQKPATNILSGTKARVLEPWQERLTLGPGDAFDVSLYGHPETARPTAIAPDGRINYLEAKDVDASGLTIDELRVKLEGVLAQYHLAPRVVITPTAFVSKKYFVLGNVNARGVYPLDRPTTVIEAIARARGFVSAGPLRNPGSAVDFSHAFLVRRNADGTFNREQIDFEGLFSRGELQHNKLLAPDDYLYFPPAGLQEIYVFGEVAAPGVLPYTSDLSVLRAIASRGGYTDAAFREKILVVRGSLQSPETFIINSAEALRGKTTDFPIQPGDIVYISRKPWAKAEEILQAAASDFARAAVVGWTGETIGVIK